MLFLRDILIENLAVKPVYKAVIALEWDGVWKLLQTPTNLVVFFEGCFQLFAVFQFEIMFLHLLEKSGFCPLAKSICCFLEVSNTKKYVSCLLSLCSNERIKSRW